jgi:diguanylate cyclase
LTASLKEAAEQNFMTTTSPKPNDHARISGEDERRLSRLLTLIAFCIAIFVTLVPPLGYFHLAREAEVKESAVAARLHAAFVTLAIANAQGDWREQVTGLISADLARSDLPEERELIDHQNRRIDQTGEKLRGFWLVISRAPINSIEGLAGYVIVKRSLQPILLNTLWVALAAALLGIAIYASLRVLPLRALRRTLNALKRNERKARFEAEESLKVIFRRVLDGIVVSDREGRITSCNPSASAMLGLSEKELRGQKFNELIPPIQVASDETLFVANQYETVIRRSSGDLVAVEVTLSESHAVGNSRRIAIVRDITERHQAQERLTQMANYDGLTGLPNRSLFRERLQAAIARSKSRHQMAALMFLDLDRFKTINDSLGHDFGDKLLQLVSSALSKCLRQSDFITHYSNREDDVGVYRLGGDEFTVLVENLPGLEDAEKIAERILAALSEPFQVDVHQIFISASIGITIVPKYSDDLDVLIKQADLAMYRSKAMGRDTYTFFSTDLEEVVSEQHELQTSLRYALERNEFSLVYQPKADLQSGAVSGVEALLRWNRPGEEFVGPDKFIPILEETGLIVPVGIWVMREACKQLMRWRAKGFTGLTMAVNLSARQFRQHDLLDQIRQIILETGVPRGFLEIELTESTLVEDSEAVVKIMKAFAQMGVGVAVDDFGTGHSSLRYLKRFDVSTLKIDRSFVQDIPHDTEDNAIATAVIALGHGLGLKVVAEGVENEAQRAFLKTQGCDEIQGYLLSKPLNASDFGRWIIDQKVAAPVSEKTDEIAGLIDALAV